MNPTERLRDTIEAAADKLKHVARSAADKVKHVARDASDLVNVVADDMPNLATAARTVILERSFAVAPEEVFKAWTDPEIFALWSAPEGFTMTDIEMDVRVGGRWANTMVSPEGKLYPSCGVYREVIAPHHLVMFDEGRGLPMNGHATKVDVTFKRAGTGTRVHLVHGVFQSVEGRDECKAGWSSSLDRLHRLLDGK